MFNRYRQLLAATRSSYSAEKAAEERRNEIAAALVYRPVSFWITPLFLALGWTADAVSVLQLGFAVAMIGVACLGGLAGALAVVGLALAIQVLDCVDGNVARVSRHTTPVGTMIDGLCTLLFWALYFVAVGVLAHGPGNWVAGHGREIGLALAALMLAQREAEDTFAGCFDERVRWTPPVADRSRFRWLPKLAEQVLAFGGLAAAAALGRLDWFLGGLAVYQVTLLAVWLPRFSRAVYRRARPTPPSR